MKKTSLNFICSILLGCVVLVLAIALNHFGLDINLKSSSAFATLVAIVSYLLLSPTIFEKVKHFLNDYDWAEETVRFYQSIPSVYKKSFWISFVFINLAFLFHTINFMWGAYDWDAIRYSVDNLSAIKEGKFSAFTMQNLLFGGKILPVINNLWSFIGLSLSGVLLAYYWDLPKKTFIYTITTLFLTITPYTLSWMYHTQNTLGNLWLGTFITTALILSQKASTSINRSYFYNLLAIFLFVLSFGTYLPVINFLFVALLGNIFLSVATTKVSFKEASLRQLQALANITASVLIYIFVILLLKESNQNAISSISFTNSITNIPVLISSMIMQFSATFPFIDLSYKLITLSIVVVTLFVIIYKSSSIKSAIVCLSLIPLLLICSKLSILLTSNYATLNNTQIDFYGLPIFYTLMLALMLKLDTTYLKRFAYVISILVIFMSFIRISYALKVWKFGFDAELKLAERIITRMEKMENFNIEHQYKLYQIGSQSLRQRYYLKKQNELTSDSLLSLAYYNKENAKSAYNFFYQTDFASQNASLDELKSIPEIKDYILNKARPWPHKESIFIHNDHIIFVLDEKELYDTQKYLGN